MAGCTYALLVALLLAFTATSLSASSRVRKCPLIKCSSACKYGYTTNYYGCQTCDCKPDPCAAKKCPRGEFCEVVTAQCFRFPCNPPSTAVCRKCPQVRCSNVCKYGFKVDKNGCQTCNCNFNPCAAKTCPKGQVCEVVPIQCLVPPCPPPTAMCRKKVPPPPVCTPRLCLQQCFKGPKPVTHVEIDRCRNCKCPTNPCHFTKCGPGQQCEVTIVCQKNVCKPRSVCETVNPCALPKVVGPCRAAMKRYYFDQKLKICVHFIYGGCQGNANNFKTLQDCAKQCGPKCKPAVCPRGCRYGYIRGTDKYGCPFCRCKPNPCTTIKCPPGTKCQLQKRGCRSYPCFPVAVCRPVKPVNVCKLRKVVGPCDGAFPRYFFNYENGKCEKFSFGGCEGNANNFKTLAACQNRCGGGPEPNPCEFGAPLPGVFCGRGPTRQDCPATHSCVIHPADRYAVCCRKKPVCPPVCLIFCEFGNVLDPNGCPTCKCKPSPCQGHKCLPAQRCELQKVVCVRAPCPPVPVCKPIDVCKLLKVVGPCRAALPRYFFNSKSGQCEKFTYGGCRGNENNFKTLAECRGKCGPKCGPVCLIFCEFGNVMDKNGCPTCKCNPSPCQAKRCGKGEFCVVEKPVCVKAPCLPIAVCKPNLPTCKVIDICPLVACRPGQQTCDENSDCARGKTCCKQCCGTKCVPTRHPGFCPSVRKTKVPAVCKTDRGCLGDFQCPEGEKCCKNGATGCMVCTKARTYTYIPKSHG